MYSLDEVKKVDPEVAQAIIDEENRQNSHIELIASENWVSKAVMAAMGSPLTNKYAEGYPGKRYYGGCECVDVIENLAIERAKKLFGCDYANVQPHSGAQANMAVQFAVLKPGDTIMGMNLDHGGHLTHGSPVNMSGKYFHVVPYGVDDNGFLDYDRMRELALECRPKMIIAGASAYARTIDFKKFREVADEVGAVLMVDMAHIAGLVAAGLHPSPIPYADVVTTTTHKTLRGPRGGMILCNKEANEKFNFNKAIFPGIQGGPLMHVIAAKAVCFEEALSDDFKVYQKNIVDNAQALCKGLMSRDIKIVSGGTDNHLMLMDLLMYHPDDILVKVDRTAMAVSLESRVPMLDKDVVEFAWSLPVWMKWENGRGKLVLRDVLYRHVPRELMERPKKGFSIPIQKWLKEPELYAWAESLLKEDKIRQEGYFDPEMVTRLWKDFTQRGIWRKQIWHILRFEDWLEQEYRKP